MRPTHRTPKCAYPTQPRPRMSTYREEAVRNRSRCDNRDRSEAVSHVSCRPSEHSKRPLIIQPLVSPASTRGKAKRVGPSKAPLIVPRHFAIMVLVTGGRALLLLTKTGKGVLVYKCRRVIGLPWARKRCRICWIGLVKRGRRLDSGRVSKCYCLSAPEPAVEIVSTHSNEF